MGQRWYICILFIVKKFWCFSNLIAHIKDYQQEKLEMVKNGWKTEYEHSLKRQNVRHLLSNMYKWYQRMNLTNDNKMTVYLRASRGSSDSWARLTPVTEFEFIITACYHRNCDKCLIPKQKSYFAFFWIFLMFLDSRETMRKQSSPLPMIMPKVWRG